MSTLDGASTQIDTDKDEDDEDADEADGAGDGEQVDGGEDLDEVDYDAESGKELAAENTKATKTNPVSDTLEFKTSLGTESNPAPRKELRELF